MKENQKIYLFVNGTLLRGFRANRQIPQESIVYDAKIVGNLYHYVAGYPIAHVPKDSSIVEGSLDYEKDMNIQNNKNRVTPNCLPYYNDFGCIYGELYEIPYSEEMMESLDHYEGFSDDKYSLYKRSLVPVKFNKDQKEQHIWAWVYNMEELPKKVVRVYSGDWRDCFRPYGAGLRLELYEALRNTEDYNSLNFLRNTEDYNSLDFLE